MSLSCRGNYASLHIHQLAINREGSCVTGADAAQAGATTNGAATGPAIPPQAVGAAVSKLISATIGEIAVIFARSPAQKHYTFADLEWMVMPGCGSAERLTKARA